MTRPEQPERRGGLEWLPGIRGKAIPSGFGLTKNAEWANRERNGKVMTIRRTNEQRMDDLEGAIGNLNQLLAKLTHGESTTPAPVAQVAWLAEALKPAPVAQVAPKPKRSTRRVAKAVGTPEAPLYVKPEAQVTPVYVKPAPLACPKGCKVDGKPKLFKANGRGLAWHLDNMHKAS
jgi:hypothetical protein